MTRNRRRFQQRKRKNGQLFHFPSFNKYFYRNNIFLSILNKNIRQSFKILTEKICSNSNYVRKYKEMKIFEQRKNIFKK